MKNTIYLLLVFTFSGILNAQTPMVQNRPCTYYSFPSSSPFTFRMPNQDNLFVDIFPGCGSGNEDNPVFYKVKTTGSSMSFTIISYNCFSGYWGSSDTQLTLWSGTCSGSPSGSGCSAPCNLTAIDCANIHKLPFAANNITFPCSPDTEYFLQFDGVGEAQCTMDITFNPGQFTSVTLPVKPIGDHLPVSIWPNPASQHLLVSYAASQDDVTLSITNMQGVKVYSRLIQSNPAFNQTEIPIEDLPKGPYLFEYRVNGEVQIEKFIKL